MWRPSPPLHIFKVSAGPMPSPTVRVANARCRVPGDRNHLAEALLYPDGVAVVEMNDSSQRYTAIQPILHVSIAGKTCNAALYPGISGHRLCLGEREVLHHPNGFRVFAIGGVKEAVSSGVLVGIAERQLVPNRILLQEAERVTDSDIVVGPREKAGTVKVRSEHHKQIRACAGTPGVCGKEPGA